MKLKMVALGLSLGALVLTGCGGSYSEPTKITKVIMDDPIVGLGYTCSPSAPSEKKFTDENGKFTCYESDKVTFYIGGYEIGTAEASEGTVDTMRIADLGVADDAITDIRRVLQTIDNTEGDDMIVIPGNFSGLDEMDVMPGDDGFEGNVTAELRHNGVIDSDEELVSAEDADRHADEAYMKYLFAGKTFYIAYNKNGISIFKKFTFSVNVETLDVEIIEGGDYKSTISVQVSDNEIREPGNSYGLDKRVYISGTDDYILMRSYYTNGYIGETKWYFTQVKAKARYDLISSAIKIPMTTAMLDGKIFYRNYTDEYDGVTEVSYARYTFNGNKTTIDVISHEAGSTVTGGGSYSVDYTIEDGKIKVVRDTDGRIRYWTLNAQDNDAWYFTRDEDSNGDGTINKTEKRKWFTSKPEFYPEFTTTGDGSGDGGSAGVITETDVRASLINKTLYRAYLCNDQMSVKKIEIGESTFNFDDGAGVEVMENAPFTITGNTVNFDDGGNIVQITLITEISVTFHDNEENDDNVWYYSREDATGHANTCSN